MNEVFPDGQKGGSTIGNQAHFPVHCVERVETINRIGQNIFVSRYTHHHGYFDGFEREFRGFAMVEQWDTEDFAVMNENTTLDNSTNIDATWHLLSAYTMTWYPIGAFIDNDKISCFIAHEPRPQKTRNLSTNS
jgi:hypothetical protein